MEKNPDCFRVHVTFVDGSSKAYIVRAPDAINAARRYIDSSHAPERVAEAVTLAVSPVRDIFI